MNSTETNPLSDEALADMAIEERNTTLDHFSDWATDADGPLIEEDDCEPTDWDEPNWSAIADAYEAQFYGA